MSSAYERAVEEKKLGDAAAKKNNNQRALLHYRRAIGAMKIYAKSADRNQRKVAYNIIAKIKALAKGLSSKKDAKSVEFQPNASASTQAEVPSEIPSDCEESGGMVEYSDLKFNDIAGMERVKLELRDAIELPLKYPDEFKRRGIPLQTGILLFGPPGCGKTYLVRCLAGEFSLPAVIVSASQLLESLVGATEKKASMTFSCARSIAPSVLFVDEIDKLLSSGARTDTTQVMTRTTNEFLTQLDGFTEHEQQSIFVAATNEPENINPAIIRPGRISQIIYVGAPDFEARKEIFRINLRGNKLDNVNYDELADLTKPVSGYKYSGAAISEICTVAKKAVIREQDKKGLSNLPIRMKHIEKGLTQIKPTVTPEMKKRYEKFAKTHASLRAD